jgi:hypothetical protein
MANQPARGDDASVQAGGGAGDGSESVDSLAGPVYLFCTSQVADGLVVCHLSNFTKKRICCYILLYVIYQILPKKRICCYILGKLVL